MREILWDLLLLVHSIDSGVCLIGRRQGDEAEATAAAGLTVLQDNLPIISIHEERWHRRGGSRTASVTLPNSEKAPRRLSSVVAQARPLVVS
jgi:hypothetical protein